jgi:hypothetical protein
MDKKIEKRLIEKYRKEFDRDVKQGNYKEDFFNFCWF